MKILWLPHYGSGRKGHILHVTCTDNCVSEILALFRYAEIDVCTFTPPGVILIRAKSEPWRWRGRPCNKTIHARKWDYAWDGDAFVARTDGGDMDADFDPFRYQPPIASSWSLYERFGRLRDDILREYENSNTSNDEPQQKFRVGRK